MGAKKSVEWDLGCEESKYEISVGLATWKLTFFDSSTTSNGDDMHMLMTLENRMDNAKGLLSRQCVALISSLTH